MNCSCSRCKKKSDKVVKVKTFGLCPKCLKEVRSNKRIAIAIWGVQNG